MAAPNVVAPLRRATGAHGVPPLQTCQPINAGKRFCYAEELVREGAAVRDYMIQDKEVAKHSVNTDCSQ